MEEGMSNHLGWQAVRALRSLRGSGSRGYTLVSRIYCTKLKAQVEMAFKQLKDMKTGNQGVGVKRSEDCSEDERDPTFRESVRCKVFLGFTSNLVSSGFRDTIPHLLEHHMVDVVITTAGGVEEVLIKCLAPTYKGDFSLPSPALHSKGLNRIDIRAMNGEAVHASSRKTGMIILGGGLPKHHICNANMMRSGADFAVFINTAQEFDGRNSGARPDEAVSWGEI
ncbi:hypothetical protein RJ639_042393 [Escallonia herrerae]|uniref:Deoxyhypusine synthase n=1 Tax=Escallonia herrerae TaxID=1293975 RepID=A0AA88WHZ3_9ASTE|nr:hypothetical protein RJ639_042393 [Escallonia herrerae]